MSKYGFWIIVGLTLALGASLYHYRGALAAQATIRHEADSLAAEVAVERLRADGWEAELSRTVEDLGAMLSERDTAYAGVARELQAARAHIASLTVVEAGATGTVYDTVYVAQEGSCEASGAIDDGVLSGLWGWSPPVFALDYRVRLRGELITAESPDGRTIVMARALDPRATFSIDSLFVDPRVWTVEKRGAPWWALPATFLVGFLAGR